MESNPSIGQLSDSFKELSDRYRQRKRHPKFSSKEELIAYEKVRKPATEAVLRSVFSHLEGLTLKTALDLGAGPATSFSILQDLSLEKIVYIEKERGFFRPLEKVEWIHEDFVSIDSFFSADLALFSYSLGELEEKERISILKKVYHSINEVLVIVEPGTPDGFSIILEARNQLIQEGAILLAPCFHNALCPLAKTTGDWCHFSKRLSRLREHRQIKGGTLGYEDEKYSYLIVTKKKSSSSNGWTILKPPIKEKHRIRFQVCTDRGDRWIEVKNKEKESYKIAKKKDWGEMIKSDSLYGV